MGGGAGPGLVERARSAVAQGGWQEAFDLLTAADAEGLLAPGDLRCLARSPTRPAISM
jgi:hypothetical protein